MLGREQQLLHWLGDKGQPHRWAGAVPQPCHSAHGPAGGQESLPSRPTWFPALPHAQLWPPTTLERQIPAARASSETIKLFLIWLLFLLQSPSAGLLQPLQQNEGIIQPCDAASVFPLLMGSTMALQSSAAGTGFAPRGGGGGSSVIPALSLQQRGVRQGRSSVLCGKELGFSGEQC